MDAGLPTILGPSPTVASLMRFEEIPVNHYTGVPQIDIPIFSANSLYPKLSLNLGLKNDGNILVELGGQVFTWKNYFTKYTFGYSEYPSGQIVELPPLIYTPISNISIEIINNTGSNYSANYQFEIGVCLKNFEDNVEISSLCYEEKNETLNFDASSVGLIGVFAVTGSTISVSVSNVINTVTQSFTVNEINQVETIVFN